MLTKIDYIIGGLVGFLTGIFAIPVLINVGFRDPVILLLLPWGSAIAFGAGTAVSGALAKKMAFFAQFGKFVAVGLLNTAVDFGILNLFSSILGVTSGLILGGVNVPGFIVAVSNSYFWNKFWVFQNRQTGLFKDLPQFLAVTVCGMLLNSLIVIMLTSSINPMFGLTDARWLNIAKLFATVFTLIWNFVGYKFIVFRKSNKTGVLHS